MAIGHDRPPFPYLRRLGAWCRRIAVDRQPAPQAEGRRQLGPHQVTLRLFGRRPERGAVAPGRPYGVQGCTTTAHDTRTTKGTHPLNPKKDYPSFSKGTGGLNCGAWPSLALTSERRLRVPHQQLIGKCRPPP